MNPTQHYPASKSVGRTGFTLVEVLIAMGLAVAISATALWMLTEGVISSSQTANISGNDLTQWGLNNRITLDSRLANGATVYTDFTTSAIATGGTAGVGVGGRGNLLVLSSTLPDNATATSRVMTITVFWFKPDKNEIWEVKGYDVSADTPTVLPYLHDSALLAHFSDITSKMKRVARDVYINDIDPVGLQAFYMRGGTGKQGSQVDLSFKLGDPVGTRRVRDSRLVNVSFYIRS